VYRTLKTFLDKGLIHKVLDDEGSLKYALCNDPCTTSSHRHEHVHFKCTQCGQTSCLDVEIPLVRLPKGYEAREVNLLIQGTCESCK
jgi:Fur family transcriptional regulator, ferric uptake regulator